MRIDLVYDRGCANVELARATIQAALRETGAEATYSEWDRGRRRTPVRFRRYGSPTVLVDGQDVCDAEDVHSRAKCCRIYREASGGFAGAPSIEVIVSAIRQANAACLTRFNTPAPTSSRPSR